MESIFTSESVTEGHPDKICDIISDSILDSALAQDPEAKMAVEATIKDDLILIYGECNTKASIDFPKIAKSILKEIGYQEEYQVIVKVNKQSEEINKALKEDSEVCAGDQGIMFGYACNETETLMPAPIYFAHKLAKRLSLIHHKYSYLGPDGKTQVSVEYDNQNIKRINTIVISTQHSADIEYELLKEIIMNEVIYPVIDTKLLDENTKFLINPSGSFVIGGSFGDSGTTGRKIICDSYGGMGRIGGGCFSSKDPTKMDRSGAYYCRYVAKSIVANGLADKCELQVSYAIGMPKPISLSLNTFNTGKILDYKILEIVKQNFDFSVSNIIKELDLKKPIYKETACYGHFGNNKFAWEKIKKIKF